MVSLGGAFKSARAYQEVHGTINMEPWIDDSFVDRDAEGRTTLRLVRCSENLSIETGRKNYVGVGKVSEQDVMITTLIELVRALARTADVGHQERAARRAPFNTQYRKQFERMLVPTPCMFRRKCHVRHEVTNYDPEHCGRLGPKPDERYDLLLADNHAQCIVIVRTSRPKSIQDDIPRDSPFRSLASASPLDWARVCLSCAPQKRVCGPLSDWP